jgi:uncharacterized membrane protein YkvA (DUF1232 family)
MNKISPQSLKQIMKYTYQVEIAPEFPANLFRFREYNPAKSVALALILFTFLYACIGLFDLAQDNIHLPPPRLQEWYSFPIALFNAVILIFSNLLNVFRLLFIFTPFIFSWLIAWLIFNPKEVGSFVLGFANILVGILEILNPVDTIPDSIPVFGSADDAFSGGLMAVGAWLISLGVKRRDNVSQVIKQLREGKIDEVEGLNLLLEDKAISIKKIEKNGATNLSQDS